MRGQPASDDKHPDLIVREAEPFNAGPPPELICASFITPTSLFFSRNHAPPPIIDPASYRLQVGGLVERTLSLSLAELMHEFPRVELAATLLCAGNRRDELLTVGPVPGEVPWGAEAVSTATWAGVPLAAVLHAAGLRAHDGHAAFLGLDRVLKEGTTFGLGGSIPLAKALSPEVLLAYEMNGAPLTPLHGFPLRVVAPGYIGARSVKWLGSISVQPEPSDNYFQAHAYKLFPPHVGLHNVDWSQGEMLGPFVVNVTICQPVPGTRLAAGICAVRGYALASEGARVAAVELSIDDGATWQAATLLGEDLPWAWRFWQAELTLPSGQVQLVARARDSAGHTMPPALADVWNFKGYMNNAWHRVQLRVE